MSPNKGHQGHGDTWDTTSPCRWCPSCPRPRSGSAQQSCSWCRWWKAKVTGLEVVPCPCSHEDSILHAVPVDNLYSLQRQPPSSKLAKVFLTWLSCVDLVIFPPGFCISHKRKWPYAPDLLPTACFKTVLLQPTFIQRGTWGDVNVNLVRFLWIRSSQKQLCTYIILIRPFVM